MLPLSHYARLPIQRRGYARRSAVVALTELLDASLSVKSLRAERAAHSRMQRAIHISRAWPPRWAPRLSSGPSRITLLSRHRPMHSWPKVLGFIQI